VELKKDDNGVLIIAKAERKYGFQDEAAHDTDTK
jgi:hypothetical protein